YINALLAGLACEFTFKSIAGHRYLIFECTRHIRVSICSSETMRIWDFRNKTSASFFPPCAWSTGTVLQCVVCNNNVIITIICLMPEENNMALHFVYNPLLFKP